VGTVSKHGFNLVSSNCENHSPHAMIEHPEKNMLGYTSPAKIYQSANLNPHITGELDVKVNVVQLCKCNEII